jgi:membrane protein YqaA with SNARE-associated domain
MIQDMSLWGLFLSAFISSTIAPGGSEAVLAYMASQGNYSASLLLSIATIGNTLGALTTWALGSVAAKKYPLSQLLPKEKQRALHLVQKQGVWILFFSWLPLIGDAFCFAGGWLKLPLFFSSCVILLGKLSRYAVVIGLFS